jgi:hypothetical protein
MTHDESKALADRLRFAAESLTLEFEGLSRTDAERLVFDVARAFLSEAQVAQFVPTFAIRRARQLLRDRPSETEVVISDVVVEVVIPDDDPFERGIPSLADVAPTPAREPVGTSVSAPARPPAYYASEAKRLLERAQALRAATLLPSDQP